MYAWNAKYFPQALFFYHWNKLCETGQKEFEVRCRKENETDRLNGNPERQFKHRKNNLNHNQYGIDSNMTSVKLEGNIFSWINRAD